jgi:flagellar biogenesis protein FliO
VKRSTFALLTLLVSVLTWDARAATPAPSAKGPAPAGGWLRPAPKPPGAASSSGAPWGKVLAIGLVAGLGGWALYTKKRRRGVPALKGVTGLRVLESARLGPKAALITAQVGRRVILLGVTDQNISKLGWLTADLESEAESHSESALDSLPPFADEPGARSALTSDEPEPAAARAASPTAQPRKARPSDGTFASRLRSALGAKPGAPSDDALAASAELTRDVVDLRRGRKRARPQPKPEPLAPLPAEEAMIDVEAQAAGLIRRLKGKSQ